MSVTLDLKVEIPVQTDREADLRRDPVVSSLLEPLRSDSQEWVLRHLREAPPLTDQQTEVARAWFSAKLA
jgi:hypothetical protein